MQFLDGFNCPEGILNDLECPICVGKIKFSEDGTATCCGYNFSYDKIDGDYVLSMTKFGVEVIEPAVEEDVGDVEEEDDDQGLDRD